MRSMSLLICAAFCLPCVADPAAQPYSEPDMNAQIAAMAKLSFLLGDWQGNGYIDTARGRVEFHQTEKISMRQQGALLSIEGRGSAPSAPADAKPQFEADALLSFDDAGREYRFYAFAQGRSGTFKAELAGPTTLRWYPGPVRYTISIESGQWHEIGERPDAKGDFVKFFEMTLQRSH
jgi:hypothetical protein